MEERFPGRWEDDRRVRTLDTASLVEIDALRALCVGTELLDDGLASKERCQHRCSAQADIVLDCYRSESSLYPNSRSFSVKQSLPMLISQTGRDRRYDGWIQCGLWGEAAP
jgi:hypothetical protein